MTRDEAIAMVVQKHKRKAAVAPFAKYWTEAEMPKIAAIEVDEFVALGLLKLDEPKTPIERLCLALNWGDASSKIFNDTLAESGLKVVRA